MPTFTNSTGLTIGDLSKSVQTLTVSGVTGRTESISITITGLTHDSSDDLDFLLVGPDGRNLVFWSDAGGNNSLANVTFTISDAGASPLSDAGHLSGGTFQPADYGEVETAFSFGAKGTLTLNHATTNGVGTLASAFAGGSAAGTWSLFVVDDTSGKTGELTSWSLNITTAVYIDLADVAAGTGGFVVHGQDVGDQSGTSVASAGDINGDGFDDLIIGAPFANGAGNGLNATGDSYVVFGGAGGFPAQINLAAIATGAGGFVLHGQDAGDRSGFSVSSAGDINGDGFDDFLIGALLAKGGGNAQVNAGDTYVVFGHAGTFAPSIDLAAVAGGAGGFVIHGQDADDLSGVSVAPAGDINGDGFGDLIIGASQADGHGNTRINAGDTYVVFGSAAGFPAEINLATIATGTGGFVIHGQDPSDLSGVSVSAGDINGDGFDDVIIGAEAGDGLDNARSGAGDTYVVFGHAGTFAPEVDLAAVVVGTGGFVIHGQDTFDDSGISVGSAGDINGDGFDDIIIGASQGDGPGNTRDAAGDTYVVFGSSGGFPAEVDLATIATGVGGFVIHGQDESDFSGISVSSAGDLNGDGFDDLLIGASRGDGAGNARLNAGDTYVVFGHAGSFAPEIDLAAVAADNGGFVIHGQDANDHSGESVSSAGDINGDGFGDLIVGAPDAAGLGNANTAAGDSYVIFGSATVGSSVNHVTHGGTTAADTLAGTAVADDMVGGRGADTLIGNGGADVLLGGEGNDVLQIADTTFLRVDGGTGVDMLAFAGPITMADTDFRHVAEVEGLRLGSGATNLTLGPIAAHAFDELAANSFILPIDTAPGATANLTIDASIYPHAVSISGDAGDDVFTALGGTLAISGGDGNDTFTLMGGLVAVDSGSGIDTVNAAFNYALGANTENLTLLGSAVNGTGNSLDNVIIGDGADNTLDGGAGNDTLSGGAGNDVEFGGSGADRLNGDTGNDVILGQDGNDTVDGGDGNDNINSGNDADVVFGGAGNDTIGGGAGDDIIVGQDGDDVIFGEDGADVANAGAGDDVMVGGLGNDTFGGGLGNDILIGGDGDDLLFGEDGIDNMNGEFGNDGVVGGAGNDLLGGGAGDDIVVGDDGDDVLFGETGNDAMNGGFGNDVLIGSDGNDTLGGGAGDDDINGGFGSDTIFGENGNDILNGSAGSDVLIGGGNDDVFVFAPGDGTDIVTDFVAGGPEDRIWFAGTNLHSFADVQAAATFLPALSATIIVYTNGTVTLNGVTPAQLTVDDFIFT